LINQFFDTTFWTCVDPPAFKKLDRSLVRSEIWNKCRTTSAFVGDLLGKYIEQMFGIKIEIVQAF
jgi:hypothetical protein